MADTRHELAGWGLGTFALGAREFAGVVTGGTVRPVGDVAGLSRPTVRELLEHWPYVVDSLDRLAAEPSPDGLPLDDIEVRAPVEPRQIFQSGANYRTHVIDLAMAHTEIAAGRSAADVRRDVAAELDGRAAHGEPYVFTGLASAVCGPYDDVVLPRDTVNNDWELELVAVIGRPARRVSPADALDHVAGYTIANDLTTREFVFRRDMKDLGTDWFRSKNAPTFLPLGPYIVPSRFVGDPGDLRVTLRLNGEIMQDESTKDMLFDVAHLIAYCSSIATLLPGDLVLTGSPAGNGMHHGRLLRPGDVMAGAITGLGSISNTCVAEGPA